MSRLIVKNLPNNVTCESLKEHFSQKGVVTDVQLKYTKKGEFRHFGFVGYQSEEQAKEAIEYFNNTYIRSVRIEVQPCSELGDASKPKSWSKYAPDSSAYKKLHKDELEAKAREEKEARKKKKKEAKFKNKTEEMISEKMKKHKNDPLFLEYLEAHGKDASNILEKLKVSEDSGVEDEGEDNKEGEGEEGGEKEVTAATAEISDLDYLKLKMKPGADEKEKLKELVQQKSKEQEKAKYYTVKISELPYNVKKPELKELFRAYHPTSIRLPPKKKGFAYIGFKTEQNMRQALSKNKSFVGNKQILVKEFKGEGDKEETKEEKRLRWKRQEEALMQEENIGESGRIFARNLAYTVIEEELEQMFSKYGPVTEVTVPVDRNTRQTKGFAHITFLMPEHAVKAHMELDGKILHGRMLHLLPGKAKPSNEGEGEQEGGQYKQKKAKKQKETATHSYNWNTLFMGQNAVADLIAQNYNTTKEKVLMGDDTAVRLALGETQIVAETREFLEDNGVKLEAFNQAPKHRSKTVLLVKNLPVNTTAAEIRDMFAKHGELGRIVLPPSGVTGIVEFLEPSEARAAFVKLAYTKFKNLPLYLEWAPDDAFTSSSVAAKKSTGDKEDVAENGDSVKKEDKKMEDVEDEEEDEPEPDTTLFIKNLNFSTNEETIKDHFSKCGKISSVTIARKKDPATAGALLSMGYGFVQFYKKKSVDQALKLLQQSLLDGHSLELKRSNKTMAVNVADVRKKTNVEKQTGVKILVRNIPFQATQKEIDQLFRVYGEIKSLRLPKKMVGTGPHRGFCFVEYLSKNDAKRAMKALCQSTHLYGRRLVLEWARGEDTVDDIRKRTADNFLTKEPSHHKRQKATADLEIGDKEEDD
ncbi:probable RNA-binding protein 19 isoform X2 [Nilaparvata lugens]|uniref:probable RNA-binding protein 19 isoform X2 n=1 Tax=Nilaparvata lugens TaxID=108931 RepID=UPI00193CF632|nr:probable RNA-binding protein 19 isoform X2 [Nilaparvata lugens]